MESDEDSTLPHEYHADSDCTHNEDTSFDFCKSGEENNQVCASRNNKNRSQ